MNLVTVALLYGTAETLARLLSIEVRASTVHHIDETHHVEEKLLKWTLYPANWTRFTEKMQPVINRMAQGSYLIDDPMLGWTNGPSRQDKTGRYFSSMEGLRSPIAGLSFATSRMHHAALSPRSASVRIALIGDSFTFADEVTFEESWGHVLETLLQPRVQVLNFGVNAYGLSQAVLRYEKDVAAWKPQIVVLGLMSDMILRSINIYPFLQNPDWDFPFMRPKLGIGSKTATPVNYPLIKSRDLFAVTHIDDLPFLDLEEYYRPYLWERGGLWYPLEKSYVFRFAYSFRAPTDDRQKERTEKALKLSEGVIERLLGDILKGGAIPVIVYLPKQNELYESDTRTEDTIPLAIQLFKKSEVRFVDPSSCLLRIDPSDAYLKGGHFSPQSNAAVARCLVPVIRELITPAQSAHAFSRG